jgi:hypothetical protein
MRQLSMIEFAGTPILVSMADGMKVFEPLSAALLAGEKVALSFKGREHVITAFLNVVIGQLYAGRIPEESLANNLIYVDLGDGDQEKIDMVVENSKRYFADRKSGLKG